MKFARYLEDHARPGWEGQYLQYRRLKKRLADINPGTHTYAPHTLSLSSGVGAAATTPQEEFFLELESNIATVGAHTKEFAEQLRAQLAELNFVLRSVDLSDRAVHAQLLQRACDVGQQYVELEQYVNLNYAGLQKILKKHDKILPQAQCRPFYKLHISRQAWVRGDHHDIQVALSRIFARLHTAAQAQAFAGDAAASSSQAAGASTALQHQNTHLQRYWIRKEDVPQVKQTLMERLPIVHPTAAELGLAATYWEQCEQGRQQQSLLGASSQRSSDSGGGIAGPGPASGGGGSSVVYQVFLDSPSLELYHNLLFGRPYATTLQIRWHGRRVPESVKVVRQVHREGWRPESMVEDKFPLPETKVADFLAGRYTWGDARKYLLPPGDGHHTHSLSDMLEALAPGGSSTDPVKLAQEYSLFKTFTEVQRLIESKGLQPMIKTCITRTIFQEAASSLRPHDSPTAAAVIGGGGASASSTLKLQLEEDVRMFLEYDYESVERLVHGMWHQVNPADAIELPYAILKIHQPAHLPTPPWLRQLLDTGLLLEVNDFSKFIHSCAGLMPDMVRAVPHWVDDEAVQKSLYANVIANQDLKMLQLAGHNVMEELEEGTLVEAESRALGADDTAGPLQPSSSSRTLQRSNTSKRNMSASNRQLQHSGSSRIAEESPMLPLIHTIQRSVSSRLTTQPGDGAQGAGWQAKLLQRQFSHGRAYQPRLMFIDPSQFMRNERIFLLWMRSGIFVGGLATGLLGFAANAYTDHTERPTIHISEVTALVLMAEAIAMVGYSLAAYVWRNLRLQEMRPGRYDDSAGAIALTVAMIISMCAMFAINIVDLVEVIRENNQNSLKS